MTAVGSPPMEVAAGAGLDGFKLAYRIKEACKAIGLGRTKLYELISDGKIATKKDGGVTIILRSELERYLNSL